MPAGAYLVVAGLCDTARADAVAYWRFETTLTDSIGSHAATAMGSPPSTSFLSDVPANPIPLTGLSNLDSYLLQRSASQWLLVPDSPALAMVTTPFTIEAWVKVRTVADVSQPATCSTLVQRKGLGNLSDNQTDYAFYVQGADRATNTNPLFCGNAGPYSGNEMVLELGNGGSGFTTIVSKLRVDDPSAWHFVSVAYDHAGSIRFMLDRQEDDVQNCAPARISPTDGVRRDITIGAKTNASGAVTRFFDGQVDELRISNTFVATTQLMNTVTFGPWPYATNGVHTPVAYSAPGTAGCFVFTLDPWDLLVAGTNLTTVALTGTARSCQSGCCGLDPPYGACLPLASPTPPTPSVWACDSDANLLPCPLAGRDSRLSSPVGDASVGAWCCGNIPADVSANQVCITTQSIPSLYVTGQMTPTSVPALGSRGTGWLTALFLVAGTWRMSRRKRLPARGEPLSQSNEIPRRRRRLTTRLRVPRPRAAQLPREHGA